MTTPIRDSALQCYCLAYDLFLAISRKREECGDVPETFVERTPADFYRMVKTLEEDVQKLKGLLAETLPTR